MPDSDIPDGYPDSPADETVPAEPPISLESADRALEAEGEVSPEGSAPEQGDREDAFSDAPDVDQLAAAELSSGSSRHEDAANFEDNAAEWSRQRS